MTTGCTSMYYPVVISFAMHYVSRLLTRNVTRYFERTILQYPVRCVICHYRNYAQLLLIIFC